MPDDSTLTTVWLLRFSACTRFENCWLEILFKNITVHNCKSIWLMTPHITSCLRKVNSFLTQKGNSKTGQTFHKFKTKFSVERIEISTDLLYNVLWFVQNKQGELQDPNKDHIPGILDMQWQACKSSHGGFCLFFLKIITFYFKSSFID